MWTRKRNKSREVLLLSLARRLPEFADPLQAKESFLFFRLHKSFELVGGDTRRMIFGLNRTALLLFFFPYWSRQHSAE